MSNFKYHILVCGGTGCRASHGEEIVENFNQLLADKGLSNDTW